MAHQNDDDSIRSELESRLDDLFGEDEKFIEGMPKGDTREDYPLSELKNLVLSIDWEITDEVLKNFLRHVHELKSSFKNDKINLTFLQILGSLGEYIKTNRGRAHPKTFKILNSVFSRFDDIVLAKGMPENEKKRILRVEMNKYKELREQIARAKSEKMTTTVAAPVHKIEPAGPQSAVPTEMTGMAATASKHAWKGPEEGAVSYTAAIAEAVAEIKEFIHVEIRSLKEELKLALKRM